VFHPTLLFLDIVIFFYYLLHVPLFHPRPFPYQSHAFLTLKDILLIKTFFHLTRERTSPPLEAVDRSSVAADTIPLSLRAFAFSGTLAATCN